MEIIDRVSTYPGRVKLTPVGGGEAVLYDMEWADEPVVEGTPLNKVNLGALAPQGIIVAWSGSADTIPDGWHLCDGTNGTPDLRDRFIVGAGNTYAAGSRGGEATHKLTVSEMPSHSHTIPKESGSGGAYGGGKYSAKNAEESSGTLATSSTGSGAAHNNLPPYYALCFIMKTRVA